MGDDLTGNDELIERLAGAALPEPVKDLVVAAVLGGDELSELLGGAAAPVRPAAREHEAIEPPRLFLTKIAVEGFRGIGPKTELGFSPGPGLTLVVGRNGSGKSSFAEGAELVLTGTASRWEKRSKVWRDGWASIHHDGPRAIEIRLLCEGDTGETKISTTWDAGGQLEQATRRAQRPGETMVPFDDLGWDDALSTWRPFLPHSELGSILDDGPTQLHQAVSAVLGLDEVLDVEQRLKDARSSLDRDAKAVTADQTRLLELLRHVDEPRAQQAASLLAAKQPDFDVLDSLATGQASAPEDLRVVSALAALTAPPLFVIERVAAELRAAVAANDAVAGTDSSRALEVADLLEKALSAHDHETDATCLVCGSSGVIDAEWRARSLAQVAALRSDATAAASAARDLRSAMSDARALISGPPESLTDDSGIDTSEVLGTWKVWAVLPEPPLEMADHVESAGLALATAVESVRVEAEAELQRRRDEWRPAALAIEAWVPRARATRGAKDTLKSLKSAADWVGAQLVEIRSERFAPIAKQVQSIWDQLRGSSNVALADIGLVGKGTHKKVSIDVAVDGVRGTALSVMSQGELNSLGLALFLPRSMRPDSPFKFLVIDDPVQAMDADRVDGLARVLSEAAETHQVIVFTHDARLPEACRRLNLPAVALEVSRDEKSVVSVRKRNNPVDDYLADARAVFLTDDYPVDVRRRVVPGLCRNALEAACAVTTRRRLLFAGASQHDIDLALDQAGKLLPRMALALFLDAGRASEVMGEVNRRWSSARGDTVKALNKGAHEAIDGNMDLLIKDTERLAHDIEQLS